tara:strand:+ start:634 stop:1761 length:1128 start_codon:yes stop_codon:yes gene_type:complete
MSNVKANTIKLDKWLIGSTLTILILGLLMLTSASMVVSERTYHTAFHFLWRQLMFLGLGIFTSIFIIRMPVKFFAKLSPILLIFTLVLLILVLIPGLGRDVNGSSRWLGIGGFGFQVSELAKLSFLLYLCGYIARHQHSVQTTFIGFVKPLIVLGVLGILLLLEPDFGTTVVMAAMSLGVLFIAGVRIRYFFGIVLLALLGFAGLAVTSPYRLQRLTTFLDPWQHQYGSGYQLIQSLIAFGRSGLTGVGLGNSIQKLFYLPEAHTDFLFAVLAEEMGLLGILAVIVLFIILVYRAIRIGKKSLDKQQFFNGYLAIGLGLWIGLQAMINMGVNAGLLPTKGLTLPLMSYGGSSLLIMCCAIAFLIRIDFEEKANIT